MTTIKEVAQRAGVGVGTVSRVLNNARAVHPETRARVERAISELDYRPNPAARQLVTSRTMTIGVILPFLTRPFYVNVLQGIEAAIASTAYHLNIFNVETRDIRTHYFREMPYRGRVDGLLIVSLPLSDEEVGRLEGAHIPTVLIDGFQATLPSIEMDNDAGARLAVEYLVARGHTRIAFISGPIEAELGFPVNRMRLDGYWAALEAHGITPNPAYHRAGADNATSGLTMTNELLSLAEPPTAIFASSDVHALGALQAANQRGLAVPTELAIVGYDDIELATYVGLTTMRQPMADMGRQGVELLLERLAGTYQGPPSHHILTASLVVRTTA